MKILFIKANPVDSDALRLDVEENAIRDVLDGSELRDHFNFQARGAVTKDLLIDHLLKIKPNILHISGHGNSDEQLLLEDVEGYSKEVSIQKLSDVLSGFLDHIDCVFLNTCHSLSGIDDFNKGIPYIIGMNNEIPDDVAIDFSRNFYNVLFNGRSIKDAFKISLATIALNDQGDEHIPKLIVNTEAIKYTKEKDQKENEEELVSTIVSEEEIEVAKNGYQKSVRFHYRLIYVAIALSLGLVVFLFVTNDQDIASSMLGLIPSAFSSYPFLEIQKKKNRITLIQVFELKRKRLLNALSHLSVHERKELNEEFMRLIII
ncbi:CHAT domain-containing protein [Kordia zhangzhouensis]|uniref:CHAT domain-containing protein n=1 Tax=Kordia zhangzhouensis TaxID=1620405 RepID=UPI00069B75CE|nr:CHAT domain-containing protein [Kordia zhangzhouensis]